jgi:hypothetical protein
LASGLFALRDSHVPVRVASVGPTAGLPFLCATGVILNRWRRTVGVNAADLESGVALVKEQAMKTQSGGAADGQAARAGRGWLAAMVVFAVLAVALSLAV